MQTSLAKLAKILEKKPKLIEKEASKLAIKAALTVLGDLVFVTPVDTSRALSNWQVSLDSKISAPIAPYFEGVQGSTKPQSARGAFDTGKAVLKGKKPGEVIWISNVLDYIDELNRGKSKQQAAKFVERAVKLGRLHIAKIKIKL